MFDHWEKIPDFIKACVKITLIQVFSTISTAVLNSYGIGAEDLLLIYLVGVPISILTTGSLAWFLYTAVVFTFTFNYLSMGLKPAFRTDNLNYMISFVIFVTVATIVATLMVKLQKQMQIADKKTEITAELDEIGSSFLGLPGYQQIKDYSEVSLVNPIGKRVTVLLKEDESKGFSSSMAEWYYKQSIPCGHREYQFLDDSGPYISIRNRKEIYGAIVFDYAGWILNEGEKIYVDTVISQVTLMIEKELLSREKEESRTQIGRGRPKSALSRSVSHDLGTSLTGISRSSGFLYKNLKIMDTSATRSMLEDICTDSGWLSSMMEDLPSMTRIRGGRLDTNKKKEVVGSIVSSAVHPVSRQIRNYTLRTGTPGGILPPSVDDRPLVQILVSLLGNTSRHSGDSTVVTFSMGVKGGNLRFVIADDGKRLPQDKTNQILDNLFTTTHEKDDRQRGVGLGLTICKATVETQGGTVQTYNNGQGGAVFEIRMPSEDKKDE